MSKTNDLKKLIQTKLLTVCNRVYYQTAGDVDMYPHIVFELNTVALGDLVRDDIVLDIDIWDKSTSTVDVDNLADSVEALFRTSNLPQNSILPTFFVSNRKSVLDEDKSIKHRQLTFEVQNYTR